MPQSEEGFDCRDYIIIVIRNADYLPFVEGQTWTRNTDADHVTYRKRRAGGHAHVPVLIIETRDPIALRHDAWPVGYPAAATSAQPGDCRRTRRAFPWCEQHLAGLRTGLNISPDLESRQQAIS
jgi:hypothetical protein